MIQRVAMTLCLRFLLVAILFFGLSFVTTGIAHAADCKQLYGTSFVSNNIDGKTIQSGTTSLSFVITGSTLTNGNIFDLYLDKVGVGNGVILDTKEVSNNQLAFTINSSEALSGVGSRSLALQQKNGSWCDNLANYTLNEAVSCSIELTQNGITNPSCYGTEGGDITVKITNIKKGNLDNYSGDYFSLSYSSLGGSNTFTAVNGTYTTTLKPSQGEQFIGVSGGKTNAGGPQVVIHPNVCTRTITVNQGKCNNPKPNGDPNSVQTRVFQLCSQITNTQLKGKCDECFAKKGVWTAVGCIERTPQNIVKTFLEIGLGVGGGICLLMCLAAGFMITTSQGDPKQVSEGREMITSAVIGLLFIIFSVFILQFIGVTIFNIPGFGVGPKP